MSIGLSLCSVTDGHHFLSKQGRYLSSRVYRELAIRSDFIKYDMRNNMIFSYFSDKGCTEIAKIQQTALIVYLSVKNSKHLGKPTVLQRKQ